MVRSGQLDVAEQLDEAGTLRRDAALGVVGALLPRADQQRPTDGAVHHHLVALERRGLHLAVLVGQPVIDSLADGRCGAFVDIASLGELAEQFGLVCLGVLFPVLGAADALARLGIAEIHIPLPIGGNGAALQLTAASGRGDGDVVDYRFMSFFSPARKTRRSNRHN